MKKCSCQRGASSCTPFVSHAKLNAGRKLRIIVGSNESNNCNLMCIFRKLSLLQRFERRRRHNETTIRKANFPVVHWFVKAVVDRADQPKVFIAVLWRFLLLANRRIIICSVSCALRYWFCRLCTHCSSFSDSASEQWSNSLFDELNEDKCRLMTLFLQLLLPRVEGHFADSLQDT